MELAAELLAAFLAGSVVTLAGVCLGAKLLWKAQGNTTRLVMPEPKSEPGVHYEFAGKPAKDKAK